VKFKKIVTSVICILPITFIKPLLLRLLGHRVQSGAKIGLSFLYVDHLYLSSDISIGIGNIIKTRRLIMKNGASIGKMNYISGYFDLWLYSESVIVNLNTITRGRLRWMNRCPKLRLGKRSQISSFSSIDLAETAWVGDDCVLAGKGTQLWTHGFIHLKDRSRKLICGQVRLGDNVYIGAHSCISAGVKIGDDVSTGAHTSIAKDLITPGLYVSAPLRLLEGEPEERLNKFKRLTPDGKVEYFRK